MKSKDCNNVNIINVHIYFSGLDPEAKVELKRPKPEEVVLGSDIQLKCSITGNPEPRYYWYQNQYQ